MPFETLVLRFTRAAGIESWLARLVAPGTVPTARLLVLMALMLWVLVLLSFVSTLHLRRALRNIPAGRFHEQLAQRARGLRRFSRVMGWMGHALLAIGVAMALLGWAVGAGHPLQTLVMSALLDLGVMQPCRVITGSYGRVVDRGTSTATTSS